MKITNPLTLIAIIVGAAVALLAWREFNTTPPLPPRTIQLESTATTTTEVPIKADDDTAAFKAAIAQIEARDTRWKDAVNLALRTPRINLVTVVQDMQAQVRSNESFDFPSCMQPGKPYWLDSQRSVLGALMNFMSDSKADPTTAIDDAARERRNFEMVLDACKAV